MFLTATQLIDFAKVAKMIGGILILAMSFGPDFLFS